MKKLLLLTLIFAGVNAFSQTEKGKFIVSGAAGLTINAGTIKYEYDGKTLADNNQTVIEFTPTFGYFVIDNLAIGLTSSISSSTQKAESGDKYNTTTISLAPTVLYFFPVEGKIKPFAQLAFGLNSRTEKDMPKMGDDEKYSASGLLISGGGGVAFFINENVSFNAGLAYNSSTLTDSDDDKAKIKYGVFGGSIGISVYF